MKSLSGILLVGLVGCAPIAGVPPQPANPATVARITAACMTDGVFQQFGGRLVLNSALSTIPGASIGTSLIDMGVDKVCANPAAFAQNIATAEWVIKNIRAAQKK